MATYDYKAGKARIVEILDGKLDVVRKDKLPKDSEFTYENAYQGWVTGIFVDIRNSTKLFSEDNKRVVSRLIRSFTSEIIEILRLDGDSQQDDSLREIGIRGDCVYGIYTTPTCGDEFEVAQKAFYINTFIEMLNNLLFVRGYPVIEVGIGVSSAIELVVKAGRNGVGINNLVWIGNAVTKASKFSGLGNKNGNSCLVFSEESYKFFINLLKMNNPNKNVESWFGKKTDHDLGTYYTADIVMVEFDNWIGNGMR